mgnify:CR=1 FL=1
MLRSLVGSEMCIRDSNTIDRYVMQVDVGDAEPPEGVVITQSLRRALSALVSYTHLTLPTIYSV